MQTLAKRTVAKLLILTNQLNCGGNIIAFLFLLLLSGCYRQWQTIDSFTSALTCNSNKQDIVELAKLHNAALIMEAESDSIQVQKQADTVVIQFDQHEQITQISVFKIELLLFGLHRRQLSPVILLNCQVKTKQ
jgi:hypothetical protein